MTFSYIAEEMHALAYAYEVHLDAMRESSIEAQEQDENWLEMAEYLAER